PLQTLYPLRSWPRGLYQDYRPGRRRFNPPTGTQ
ncbi:hypothetical protein GBF38_000726, partial [Nibea albiflora]